jgi:heme A synthase
MTMLATWWCSRFYRLPGLTRAAKLSTGLLMTALWSQVGLGIYTIYESVPIHLASMHQIGAMTVLSAFLFCLHTCRGIDLRHMRNLFGKLKAEDP